MDLETISTIGKNLASDDYNPAFLGILAGVAAAELSIVFYLVARQIYPNYRTKKSGEDLTKSDSSGGYR